MTFHEPSNMLSPLWPGAASNLILHITSWLIIVEFDRGVIGLILIVMQWDE